MRIGVLEDDMAIQELLRLVLQDEGNLTIMYSTAEECLQALAITEGEQVPIDLLMVDWRLPGLISGTEVIRQLRSKPRFHSLPIILTTAAALPNTEELQNLHITFLEKPFDIDEVVRVIKSLTDYAPI